jgi:hypothetical protein
MRSSLLLVVLSVAGCAKPPYVRLSEAAEDGLRGPVVMAQTEHIRDGKHEVFSRDTYDRYGNRVRMELFPTGGELLGVETETIDSKGHVVEKALTNNGPNGQRPIMLSKCTYESDGRPKSETKTIAIGKVTSVVTFKFDSTGRISEKTETMTGSGKPLGPILETRSYHQNGQLSKQVRGSKPGESGMTNTVTFDQRGFEQQYVMAFDNRTLVTTYTKYKIDSHGSWTSRKVASGDDHYTEVRKIQYRK